MPRYHRLSSDIGQSPWELMETLPLQRALGIAAAESPDNRPPAPGKTIRDLLAETVDPRDIEQPLELHVEGRRRASLMRRRRGFGRGR